jgi:23S rRNA A1618 N6-methylase RlmF
MSGSCPLCQSTNAEAVPSSLVLWRCINCDKAFSGQRRADEEVRTKSLGQVAQEAFRDALIESHGEKTAHAFVTWSLLHDDQRKRWEAAAQAAVKAVNV